MARKFISYNGRIVSDNLTLKLLGQDVSPPPTPPSEFTNCKSLSFDGVDDFVSVANSNILDGLQKATWSFWFKKSGTGAKYLSGHYNNGNQFLFLFIPSSNRIDGYINGVRPFNNNSTTISVDTWYNAVFVLDSTLTSFSDRLKLFINGTQISNTGGATLPQNATLNSDSGDILIGKATTGFNWDGNIDEVSFWDDAKDISDIWDGSGLPTDLSSKSNLLAWWRMGDGDTYPTLTDNGSGGNDGTMTNMSSDSIVYDVPLFNTRSILFDGVDDYVSISANSNLQISDTFTISHWVKFTSTSQMYVTNFANKYGTFVQNGYAYLVFRNLSNTQISLQSTSTINDGNWHNITAIKTTSTMAIYIDGILDANNTNGATGITSTSSNAIGALFNGAIRFLGNIDEVAVWNNDQSANASAIGSTIPTDLSTYSPLSWWRCGDGDTSPTLTDNGSGGNDGTMTNFSTFSTDVPT